MTVDDLAAIEDALKAVRWASDWESLAFDGGNYTGILMTLRRLGRITDDEVKLVDALYSSACDFSRERCAAGD
ncbi:hypothetical protein [Pseudomonas sp. TCU-HL1]|uniref:hypothetical protein n=1 Tax=Pseudomonas sp. TCU-HL1 TaxID=1856685 RepID=UPI00083D4D57|nr:hypothetical protein [Pseudomonas sp. TCU-HL1]AOE85526.1 hydrogenase [Pseudomonas sp. TCU-HL1]AOE85538.1 hydrogenase [Pseudomonas sp. TCU-HL1]